MMLMYRNKLLINQLSATIRLCKINQIENQKINIQIQNQPNSSIRKKEKTNKQIKKQSIKQLIYLETNQLFTYTKYKQNNNYYYYYFSYQSKIFSDYSRNHYFPHHNDKYKNQQPRQINKQIN
ncbi:hypothetical protein ABPG74_014483 [Tetrahymena malaccensis]